MRTALEWAVPLVVDGGVVVIDDYYTYSGAKTATDEFLGAVKGYQLEAFNLTCLRGGTGGVVSLLALQKHYG